jgi:hypothetical protein
MEREENIIPEYIRGACELLARSFDGDDHGDCPLPNA